MQRTASRLLGGLLGLAGMIGLAHAQTAVRVMGIEPNDPKEKVVNEQVIHDYEAAHPATHVTIEYLENEAFKSKLPTVLQSRGRPDLFWSWAGGVFEEQARNQVTKDISADTRSTFAASMPEGAVNAFSYGGHIQGAPTKVSLVVLWYNKDLAARAGIDATAIATWDDFLAAVSKARAAGITPIAVAGKDKFPLQFYVGYLAVRVLGRDGIAAARAGENGGFQSPGFIRVLSEYKRLTDLKPFQDGFASATFAKETGMFGDGKALFELAGNWNYSTQRANSEDGKGLPDSRLGMIEFPSVSGGKGGAHDVLGGINGWLVTHDASPAAVDFLKYWVSKDVEEKYAAAGMWIPIVKGAGEALSNPFFKQVAEMAGRADYLQLYLDQAFGPNLGGAINDVSADLAIGATTPEKAAATLEAARAMQ